MKMRVGVRLAAALAVVALAVSAAALAGCQQQAAAPSKIPVQAAAPDTSGTIAGLEIIAEETLPMGEKADVDGWQASGGALDTAPTLKAGTYKPIIATSDIAEVGVATGSMNGIAQKVIRLSLTPAGTSRLAAYTQGNVGKTLVVIVKGKAAAAMTLNAPVTDGQLELFTDAATSDYLAGLITK